MTKKYVYLVTWTKDNKGYYRCFGGQKKASDFIDYLVHIQFVNVSTIRITKSQLY